MLKDKIFIFDFDSTFIQVETLEVLAEVSLLSHPEKEERLRSIHTITEQAMEGRYSYSESLKERVALLNLSSIHLQQTIEILKQKITPSILRNMPFFKANAGKIYIFSGSFLEIVWPIVQPFGLKRDHIFGNRLLYDFENNILGYDELNPLAQDSGKVKLAHHLKLQGDIYIIGDGYTDYELKASGIASSFFAFTENIARQSIMDSADAVISELEGLFLACQIPYDHQKENKKVLLLENLHPIVSHYFTNLGYEVEKFSHALPFETLKKKIKGIHILGIRSKTEVTTAILEEANVLEAIGAFCIGTNQISLNECSKRGIAAFNAPFSNTRSVVELAMGEIILLVRRAASASNQLRQGEWLKTSHNAHEVRGKILGIVGYGNIGSQLSIIAEAMGMQILFYDIDEKLALGNAKRCHTLEELLSTADIVTIHIDGRKENHHFISQKEFNLMKDQVIFLNLSRGFVVDFEALIQAMESGKVAGIGIDVYPEEPHESKSQFKTPLQRFDNIFITPHIGGSTEEAQKNIGEYVSKNLHAYMNDGASIGSVNFPQLYLPTMNYPQRLIHIHKNVPGILAKINSLFAQNEINIEGQFLKTNEEIGYVITDIHHEIENSTLQKLQSIPHTIKVRLLNKYV